jgi:hypothetical protein
MVEEEPEGATLWAVLRLEECSDPRLCFTSLLGLFQDRSHALEKARAYRRQLDWHCRVEAIDSDLCQPSKEEVR